MTKFADRFQAERIAEPPPPPPPVPKALDVQAELESIARGLSEADAARVRTLIYLASQQQTGVSLPVPVTQQDQIDRLARLLKACGPAVAQLAYRKAFPSAKTVIKDVPLLKTDDIDLTGVKMPISLKQLYRYAPEVKRPGYPRGYPVHGALNEKTEWVQQEYLRVLRMRKQREIDAAARTDAEANPAETSESPEASA